MIDRVVVISDDSSGNGGAASVALASVRLLRQRGVPVTVLAGDAGNAALSELGVDVLSLGGKQLLDDKRASAAVRGLYSSDARTFLDHWIDSNDSPQTVYHLHNWHKILSPSIFGALQRVERRLLLSPHDYFLVCPNGNFYHYKHNHVCNLNPMSLSCLLTNCDKRNYGHKLWRVARHSIKDRLFDLRHTEATVLAVHESMVPLLIRGGIQQSQIRVVRNPVTPWTQTRIAAERNKDIFFVGRLELDKGIDILARVARRIQAPLRVIGDGSLKSSLQANYPEVTFLGQQVTEGLARIIRDARAIVVPTKCPETFGLVSLESLMSGIPVIVSNSSPFAGDIVRSGFGLSFDVRDENDLAIQIDRIMTDDGFVRDMSERAHVGARTLAPDADEWCDGLVRIYEEKLRASERTTAISHH